MDKCPFSSFFPCFWPILTPSKEKAICHPGFWVARQDLSFYFPLRAPCPAAKRSPHPRVRPGCLICRPLPGSLLKIPFFEMMEVDGKDLRPKMQPLHPCFCPCFKTVRPLSIYCQGQGHHFFKKKPNDNMHFFAGASPSEDWLRTPPPPGSAAPPSLPLQPCVAPLEARERSFVLEFCSMKGV